MIKDILLFLNPIMAIYVIMTFLSFLLIHIVSSKRGHHGRYHMVVEFTTTCTISTYHH